MAVRPQMPVTVQNLHIKEKNWNDVLTLPKQG